MTGPRHAVCVACGELLHFPETQGDGWALFWELRSQQGCYDCGGGLLLVAVEGCRDCADWLAA